MAKALGVSNNCACDDLSSISHTKSLFCIFNIWLKKSHIFFQFLISLFRTVSCSKDLYAHIEAIISRSLRMMGFIKRISREFHNPYTHKTLYTSLVRPNLDHATCVWSPHQSVYSEWLERVEQNFIRYVVRRLPCSVPVASL
jgi:hypothetical protein